MSKQTVIDKINEIDGAIKTNTSSINELGGGVESNTSLINELSEQQKKFKNSFALRPLEEGETIKDIIGIAKWISVDDKLFTCTSLTGTTYVCSHVFTNPSGDKYSVENIQLDASFMTNVTMTINDKKQGDPYFYHIKIEDYVDGKIVKYSVY